MLAEWSQVLNSALAVLNFAIASLLVLRSFTVNREIAAATVTAAAQSAYQDLLDVRSSVTTAEAAERFYDRFWAAQALQFEQWRGRLIPDVIYSDWLLYRRRQFAKNATLAGLAFQASWMSRFEERYRHTAFGRFMNRVLAEGASVEETGRQAIDRIRRAMRGARSAFAG